MCTQVRTPSPSSRTDGEGEEVAQIDAPRRVWRGRIVGLELAALAVLDEQALEGRIDRRRGAEHAIEPSSAASRTDDGEITRSHVAETLSVEDDRDTRREERFAHRQLAASGDLDDEMFPHYFWSSTSAAASASSDGVRGLSTARTSGSTPRREMSIPAGVR
jgi:hypothetical protein